MIKNERLKNILSGIKFKYGVKTQAEIAQKIGTSPTYLSDILSGKYPISDKISETFINVRDDQWDDGSAMVVRHRRALDFVFGQK